MTVRTYIRSILLIGLATLSVAGFMIHVRVHLITENPSFILPFVAGILNMGAIPALFCFKKTVAYGYVLNGILCIIGTVTMTHFAIARWSAPTSPPDILLKSMVIDILIVWGKFFIGKALFELETFGYEPNRPKRGIVYRYPNMGWWLIHLAAISIVYYLGNVLWS
ncbi:MAG: hypothetical protein ACE144_15480 [Thermodesulfobacteriota bacterium]